MAKSILDMIHGSARDLHAAKKPNGPSLKLLNLVADKGLEVLA